MALRLCLSVLLLSPCAVIVGPAANAVSPASVAVGHQLFEHQWPATNPVLGSDGLGPLFNGNSCVTCHHQGGVGGGGEAEFNAHSIGIEQLRIVGGVVDQDVLTRMIRTFHPGFVQPGGTVINAMALPHHGGSALFAQSRTAFLAQLPAQFSPTGGPTQAAEVRQATATPVLFTSQVGDYQMTLRARLFQRNTPALYGAGLIDQVPDRLIQQTADAQRKHPEISGRPSTLTDGRFGKFGWRANVATLVEFTDQACANEVGLNTHRKPQAPDPMQPGYRNPGVDINDEQIERISDFVAALPTPLRSLPGESEDRLAAQRGEQLFAAVGCAVCHVPTLGPAAGIYSDLLLHDMGYESIDLNHAEPYIVRATPQTRVSTSSTERVTGTQMTGGYYGPATEIAVDFTTSQSTGDFASPRRSLSAGRSMGFEFNAPDAPLSPLQLIDLDYKDYTTQSTQQADSYRLVDNARIDRNETKRVSTYVRVHYEPTNFNQEWRTPPLWGVRDSAPYMHDGRAETLLESIAMHDGESAGTRDRFLNLSVDDRQAVLAFLNTLVAPPTAPQPRS